MSNKLFETLQSAIDDAVTFYREQQKVVDLWSYESDNVTNNNTTAETLNTTIQKFIIQQSGKIALLQRNDIDSLMGLIRSQIQALCDNMERIMDENQSQVSDDVFEALDIILGQIYNFKKVFDKQEARFRKNYLDNPEFTDEKKIEAFIDLLRKQYSNFFDDTVSAVYRGIEISSQAIYEIVLGEINNFLKNTGIYTYPVQIGTKINFDFCSYTEDETAKETENIEQDDCIYDIRQYPYMIGNDILLSQGKVCTWRFAR